MNYWLTCAALFFVLGGQQRENAWREKVAAAVAEARQAGTAAAYRAALETTWRADDWQAGIKLAREALERFPDASELRPLAARALWRAGRIAEAERIADELSPASADRVGLRVLIEIDTARGRIDSARACAERLATLKPLSAEDLFFIMGARIAHNRLEGVSELARRATELADPANGYPEIYVIEQLQGLPEFFDAVGTKPLNQIVQFGEAEMPVVPLVNLPGCQAMINGKGPYRMIVDTGGSITLSLDQAVAAELGLKSIAPAVIHGVGGREESGQMLVEALTIGGITCQRVVTRTFELRKAMMYAADGIIGTGMFGQGRMVLDFSAGRLRIEPSSERAGAGRAAELRIVGDGKLLSPMPLDGGQAVGLLDSGADAFAVSPSRLRAIFPDRKITTVPVFALGVGGDQQPQISLTPGVSFEFAGRRFKDFGGLGLDVLDTVLSPMLGIQCDLLLGMPLMRDMRSLTVDFPHSRMWVEWLADK